MVWDPTASVLQVADLLRAFDALGLEANVLCRSVGLRRSVLRTPTARIPATTVAALFEEAERRTGDPLIALRAAERARPSDPLVYLVMSRARLDDGLRQIERFVHVALDSMQVRLTRESRRATLSIDLGAPLAWAHRFADYTVAIILFTLRRTIVSGLPLREVHFRHADFPDPAAAARLLGCPIRLRQPGYRIVFPLHALRTPLRHSNAAIAAQMEQFALGLVAGAAPHPSPFRDRVEEALRVSLRAGVPADRAAIAHRLHASERTLQRRLADERTSFTTIRDATLLEVASGLLANPALSVKAVALSTGFANVASFSKAFKRHTGRSPTRYRAGH